MKSYGIKLWKYLEKKELSCFFQQRRWLRKRKLENIPNENIIEKGNEIYKINVDRKQHNKNGKKDEEKNEKKDEKKEKDELGQAIEEVKKKLYKKYNHYEIESDPNNVYMYEKNYEELNELNIHKMLLLGLQKMNIKGLNEMQINSFLTIQKGKDVIINYPDGTGKTLAYLLPILNNLYFLHDFLETIILNTYQNKNKNKRVSLDSFKTNKIEHNFKFNNNFDLYKDLNNFFLKYGYYKNNVLLDNDCREEEKWKNAFNLLPRVLNNEIQGSYMTNQQNRKGAIKTETGTETEIEKRKKVDVLGRKTKKKKREKRRKK